MRSSRVTRPDTPPYSSTTRRDVHGVAVHLLQKGLGLHRLGNEDRRSGDAADRSIPPARLIAEAELHEVLEVEHPDDVVRVVVDDRNARDALLEEDRHRRRASTQDASTVTMSVRGTMTARTNVSVKSNTEWISSPIVLFDELVLGGLVDDAEQLLFGGERRSARGSRRNPVAQCDQAVRERSEDDAHAPDDGCGTTQQAAWHAVARRCAGSLRPRRRRFPS